MKKHDSNRSIVWPNVQTACLFLRGLIGDMPDDAICDQWKQEIDLQQLADWLIQFQLAAVTCRQYEDIWPELTHILSTERFAVMAQNTLHFESIGCAIDTLEAANLPLVVLKGCAIAEAAWGDVTLRPMSDADIWIPAQTMEASLRKLHEIGYRATEQTSTLSLERQRLVTGVIELTRPGWQYGLIDIHWRPLHGWWVRHCANIDFDAMWQRRVPVTINGCTTNRLDNEDQLLHLAVHMSINAHFGTHASIRGLLDIIFCVETWPVDWHVVATRAEHYRIKTVVWFVLDLAQQMMGWNEGAAILSRLAPPKHHQQYLRRLVNPSHIINAHDMSPSRWRFVLIFALADRWRDIARYLGRTIVPEVAWRTAKYGRPVPAWHHSLVSLSRKK